MSLLFDLRLAMKCDHVAMKRFGNPILIMGCQPESLSLCIYVGEEGRQKWAKALNSSWNQLLFCKLLQNTEQILLLIARISSRFLTPFRTLVQDYNSHCYVGFLKYMWVLPTITGNLQKEMLEERRGGSLGKAEKPSLKETFEANPHVKELVVGNILEMLERGII